MMSDGMTGVCVMSDGMTGVCMMYDGVLCVMCICSSRVCIISAAMMSGVCWPSAAVTGVYLAECCMEHWRRFLKLLNDIYSIVHAHQVTVKIQRIYQDLLMIFLYIYLMYTYFIYKNLYTFSSITIVIYFFQSFQC